MYQLDVTPEVQSSTSRFQLLGPIAIHGTNHSSMITSYRQRAILAVLLLEANYVVPTQRLAEATWGDDPPPTARSQVQICISALRRSMHRAGMPASLITRPPGYLLKASDDDIDIHCFERLAAAGRAAAAAGRLPEAVEQWRAALALWRGLPAENVDSPLVQAAVVRLTERRLALIEDRIDCELQLGRGKELIGELMALISENPLRERQRGQLMKALYFSGRQADALEAYRQAREFLRNELGIDPTKELRILHHSILTDRLRRDGSRPERSDSGVFSLGVTSGRSAPRLLPGQISDLIGRDGAATEVVREICCRNEELNANLVRAVVISGMVGVGKTALAIHAAHRVVGEFPDGQLYADLQDDDAQPVSPKQVLKHFLLALGTESTDIPDNLAERAGLYRHQLADRRILVVLDNAVSEDQVMPLLPGSPSCSVMMTSQRRLLGLSSAHHVSLKPLSMEDSVKLITASIGRARVRAEPAVTLTLAGFCGGSPLALGIVAARLAEHSHWPIQRITGRLTAKSQLDELNRNGHGARKSFAACYHRLRPDAQRLFRRLSLLRNLVFPAWMAQALLDGDPWLAEDVLADLVDSSLVTEQPSRLVTRYRIHDLLKAYAAELLQAEETGAEKTAALGRIHSSWLSLAEAAHHSIYGGDYAIVRGSSPRRALPAHVVRSTSVESLTWYSRERSSLQAAVMEAAEFGAGELCWELAMLVSTLSDAADCYDGWQETSQTALMAALRANDKRGEAAMLYSLGVLHLRRGRHDQGGTRLSLARGLFEDLGDSHGAALALGCLASIDWMKGRIDRAGSRYAGAITALRQAGDSWALADALHGLGQVFLGRGEWGDAQRLGNESLVIATSTGSQQLISRCHELVAAGSRPTGT